MENARRNFSFKFCFQANFRRKFGLFFIFEDLAFLTLVVAKFGLFEFFEPGNPDANALFHWKSQFAKLHI